MLSKACFSTWAYLYARSHPHNSFFLPLAWKFTFAVFFFLSRMKMTIFFRHRTFYKWWHSLYMLTRMHCTTINGNMYIQARFQRLARTYTTLHGYVTRANFVHIYTCTVRYVYLPNLVERVTAHMYMQKGYFYSLYKNALIFNQHGMLYVTCKQKNIKFTYAILWIIGIKKMHIHKSNIHNIHNLSCTFYIKIMYTWTISLNKKRKGGEEPTPRRLFFLHFKILRKFVKALYKNFNTPQNDHSTYVCIYFAFFYFYINIIYKYMSFFSFLQ